MPNLKDRNMETKNKIELIQTPIIKHSLVQMGLSVTSRLAEQNINNLIATEDTVGTLKKLRADLNREAKEFELQRKVIKEAVLSPYNSFEAIYKEQIITKYKDADETLKNKINDFEMKLKTDKKVELEAYFSEICEAEKIDWLSYKELGIEINLSTSTKKYKEQILEKIQGVVDDINLITTDKYSAEILVEYKISLNASLAIQTVRQRKQKEKEESDRLLFERTRRRTDSLRKLQLVYHDMTRTYNWLTDESVMIKYDEVESLSDDDWQKKHIEIEEKVRIKENKPQALRAPIVSTPITKPSEEELFEARFLVKDTYSRLKALGDLLKSNNYNYQNIKES